METRPDAIRLNVNEKKTKYMIILTPKGERQFQDLKIGNTMFGEVNNFMVRIRRAIMERIRAGSWHYFKK